jgi:hypothetical protein
MVDGRFEWETAESTVHIEAQGESSCPPVHNDLDCQICRIIGRDLITPLRVVPALGLTCTVAHSAPAMAPWHRSAVISSTLGARAPPLI